MEKYELTCVLPENISPSQKKLLVEKLEKILKGVNGSLKKSEEWGKLELAYPIKKNNSGIFLHFVIELNPDKLKLLNDKIRIESSIIRYLLVKVKD